jgi:hypothetical protein
VAVSCVSKASVAVRRVGERHRADRGGSDGGYLVTVKMREDVGAPPAALTRNGAERTVLLGRAAELS